MPFDEVRIPKDRISMLIGTKGSEKKLIEKTAKVKLNVDSKEGLVVIEGKALDVYNAKPIIKAIGRGFNPDKALKLLNEHFILELVDIKEFGKTKNDFVRIKARIIGRKGTCREHLENLTDTSIVVYGKTVGIIGTVENCLIAKQGIEKLLKGSKHGNVYKWIEIEKKESANIS